LADLTPVFMNNNVGFDSYSLRLAGWSWNGVREKYCWAGWSWSWWLEWCERKILLGWSWS